MFLTLPCGKIMHKKAYEMFCFSTFNQMKLGFMRLQNHVFI